MKGTGIFTAITMIVMVAALLYRVQTLHQKKIWNLSVQQLIHLVLIPGILFPMIFTYLQGIVRLPRNTEAFLSDGFLVNMVLLSLFFTYGGVAIHAVTKMMSESLSGTETEAAQINAFFHMTFSHNLTFVGILAASFGLILLEINHIPSGGGLSLWSGLWRGLLLGGSFAFAAYNYTRYTGGDLGRWNDLKITFGAAWLVIALLIYIVEKLDIGFSEYQLLLPMLLSFSIMAFLSLILVFRRIKRGQWRVKIGKKRLKRYLTMEESA